MAERVESPCGRSRRPTGCDGRAPRGSPQSGAAGRGYREQGRRTSDRASRHRPTPSTQYVAESPNTRRPPARLPRQACRDTTHRKKSSTTSHRPGRPTARPSPRQAAEAAITQWQTRFTGPGPRRREGAVNRP